MKDHMVIMNFTDIYKEQEFWRDEEPAWAELTQLTGCSCYCDEEAAKVLRQEIGKFPVKGIHFLDSGNYHYATKLWADRICQPFDLLVLDHHTDMQQPAFGGILSCGGWLRTALEENKFLQRVCLMGPSEKMAEEDEIGEFGDRLLFFDEEKMQKGFWREFLNDGGEEEPKKRRPLYISLDKDILCEEEAAVNWDQGTVRLSEVLEVLEAAFRSRPVIGADLCGENPLDMEDGEQLLKADSLNEKLLGALKRWMGN